MYTLHQTSILFSPFTLSHVNVIQTTQGKLERQRKMSPSLTC